MMDILFQLNFQSFMTIKEEKLALDLRADLNNVLTKTSTIKIVLMTKMSGWNVKKFLILLTVKLM